MGFYKLNNTILPLYKNLRPYDCKVCDKSFKYPCILKKHMKDVHSKPSSTPVAGEFICDENYTLHFSPHTFQSNNFLLSSLAVKQYVCELCTKSYPSLKHLNGHKREVHLRTHHVKRVVNASLHLPN